MDSVVSSALEEICVRGASGIPLKELWTALTGALSSSGIPLCSAVKTAIWDRLRRNPSLGCEPCRGGPPSSQHMDPSTISLVEAEEEMGLIIVAEKNLRDSFLGLYDIKAADGGISEEHVRVLERIALARSSGITQSDLSKHFGVKGNNFFYKVRGLECQQLIVRQSSTVRRKEMGDEGEAGVKTTPMANTNLLHLYRYGKMRLGSQQRFEIVQPCKLGSPGSENENQVGGNDGGEIADADIQIKDYLPAMKSVCNMLEDASGKVLVVSDIKHTLGYRRTVGHRAWRNILNRLKDTGVVEEFPAIIDGKEKKCLRLVSKFDCEGEQPMGGIYGEDVLETEPVELERKGQTSEELVELPFEHLLFDLIDAEGPKGFSITEIAKRFGPINHKRLYSRVLDMSEKYEMHLDAEQHKKTTQYRISTSRVSQMLPETHKKIANALETSTCSETLITNQPSSCNLIEVRCTTVEVPSADMFSNQEIGLDGGNICFESTQDNHVIQSGLVNQDDIRQPPCLNRVMNLSSTCNLSKSNTNPESSSRTPETTSRCHSGPRYPCLGSTVLSVKREQLIIERLRNEKFILKADLQRWLSDLEESKATIDRKTVVRTLTKLQGEGYCKFAEVTIPFVTNCSQSRKVTVILDASIDGISNEILDQIYDKQRTFDAYVHGSGSAKAARARIHGQGSANSYTDKPVTAVTNVERLKYNTDKVVNLSCMIAKGFVYAKMVRAKLLHNFFWSYLSSLPHISRNLNSCTNSCGKEDPYRFCQLFDLEMTVKEMTLELFLQVVGYAGEINDLVEKCRVGIRLSDLPLQQYRQLMDTHATARLSSVVDILVRLKLIQLVPVDSVEDHMTPQNVVLAYALVLKPFLEEPLPRVLPSENPIDFPMLRHEYVLSSQENLDAYWESLEYYYATVDQVTASNAFPGSAVPELFHARSWAAARVMSIEQRQELLKRLSMENAEKKITFHECVKIARELKLSVDQVLRFSYDKRHSNRSRRNPANLNWDNLEKHLYSDNHGVVSRKRKRGSRNDRPSYPSSRIVVSDGEQMMKASSFRSADSHNQNNKESAINFVLESEPIIEEANGHSFVNECTFYRSKRIFRKKFIWTDSSDRKLVEQYCRRRALLGARVPRVDWSSMADLPSDPYKCKRRIAALKSDMNWFKAVMRLCDILGERYTMHLEQTKKVQGDHSIDYDFSDSGKYCKLADKHEPREAILQENTAELNVLYAWDDFDDPVLRAALEEVMKLKRTSKKDNVMLFRASELPSYSGDGFVEKQCPNPTKLTMPGRSRPNLNHLHRKYIHLLSRRDLNIRRQISESLSVANAVELLKVAFLSTSSIPEVQRSLAATLRLYSEQDIFSAFNYLKEGNYLVTGHGSRPYVLSKKFWEDASSSAFPINTGKRALKFSSWLDEHKNSLILDGLVLIPELQCGEFLHLFSLIASGELSISPNLPEEGIGEALESSVGKSLDQFEDACDDDSRCSNQNCDVDNMTEDEDVYKAKLRGKIDSDFSFRRAKGFPGLKVMLNRTPDPCNSTSCMTYLGGIENQTCNERNQDIHCSVRKIDELLSLGDTSVKKFKINAKESAISSDDTIWNTMSSEFLKTKAHQNFSPEMFKRVHSAIHDAGDQGLTIEYVSKLVVEDVSLAQRMLNMLELCDLIIKVNAYDGVRMVDSSYRSKYSITVPSEYKRYPDPNQAENTETSHRLLLENKDFKITKEYCDTFEESVQKDAVRNEKFSAERALCSSMSKDVTYKPILPWINGDGSINAVMYKGLRRRLVGTVMQNPGIMEDDIVRRMNVLNPQSCRQLIESLILDNHIFLKEVQQIANATPVILKNLLGTCCGTTKPTIRKHYFANPLSTSLL